MGVAYDNETDADNPENIDTRHDNCFFRTTLNSVCCYYSEHCSTVIR